eukprot:g52450.t1
MVACYLDMLARAAVRLITSLSPLMTGKSFLRLCTMVAWSVALTHMAGPSRTTWAWQLPSYPGVAQGRLYRVK